MVELYRRRFEHYGHGPADTAIVGLGGQFFMRRNSQDAVNEFRPYFDNAPVYGHGPSLEDFTEATPLTVGSPQQVLERTLSFRDYVGDYQRQLFLVDHAGLPLKTVLEQLDLLGEILPGPAGGLRRGPPGARPGRPHPRLAGRRRRRRHDSTVHAVDDVTGRPTARRWRHDLGRRRLRRAVASPPRPGCSPTGSPPRRSRRWSEVEVTTSSCATSRTQLTDHLLTGFPGARAGRRDRGGTPR